MVAFAALAAIGFGIKKMMQKTNNAKKTLYSIGGLLVIMLISYLMATEYVLGFITVEQYTTGNNDKEILNSTAIQSGMGLIAFYILVAGAIGAVLYAELSKVFSK